MSSLNPMPAEMHEWSAHEVIQYFTKEAPVDVVPLAEALGVKVWERPMADLSGVLTRDHNGGRTGYSIYINAHDPVTRKRFTVAHEIAHYLLHRRNGRDEFKDNMMYRSPGLSNELEAEANRLAADILMPRRLIRRLLDLGITSPSEMASRLKVSPQAMEIRLGLHSRIANR